MISVKIYEDQEGQTKGFKVSGHALFDNKGRDIVCAGVSILTINTVNSIEKFLPDQKMQVNSDNRNGYIECILDGTISEKARLLLDTYVFGIENIEENYGKKYIEIVKEVKDHA
ncbi:MAG: ribosomal-processing cysteine protease Prp [Lachnospiraceae bacterium]|nr:ribosomal-processing cysteine protease Prp [Lachnospiraceae bacterium]